MGESKSFARELGFNPIAKLTGQLADKPTRGQSSRGLDNSRTGQLADSEYFLKSWNYYTAFVY